MKHQRVEGLCGCVGFQAAPRLLCLELSLSDSHSAFSSMSILFSMPLPSCPPPPPPSPPDFFRLFHLRCHPARPSMAISLLSPPSPFHRSVIMLTRRSRWKWIGSEGLLEWRLKKGSAREETAESVRDGGGRKSGGRPLMEAHTDERLIVTKLCKGGGG